MSVRSWSTPETTGIRVSLLLVACIALACTPQGDGPGSTDEGGSGGGVLLVTVDSLRLGGEGTVAIPTSLPNLTALGAEGTLYRNVSTTVPQTLPAAATILTGTTPDVSRVRANVVDHVPEDLWSVAGAAGAAGWETVAIVGSSLVSYPSKLDRHFELFDGPDVLRVGPEAYAGATTSAESVAETFERWASSRTSDRPFFAWVHFANLSYIHPGARKNPENAEVANQAYAENLSSIDAALGRISEAAANVAGAGSLTKVFAGTYGVAISDDGPAGSGYWLAPEVLRVPVIVSDPGGTAGVDDAARWLPDVTATLCDAIGVALPPGAEGRSLDTAEDDLIDRVLWAWTWATEVEAAWPPLTAARRAGEPWVVEPWTEEASESDSWLRERMARPYLRSPDPGLVESLRSIGVDPTDGGEFAPGVSDDARTELFVELQRMRWAMIEGRMVVLNRTARRLREMYPDQYAVMSHDAFFAEYSQAYDVADRISAALLGRYPNREASLHIAGHAAIRNADLERAEVLLRGALAYGAPPAEVTYDLACVLARAGKTRDAVETLGDAIRAGYRNWQHIEQDPDLAAVRGTREFAELMSGFGR